MGSRTPYLSVVVAARHDDHGGNFMRRMQIFLDGLVAQCTRHQVPAELIIVEWNPLADRCKLVDALLWPADLTWCRPRILEVPPEVHARFRNSKALPLFQMIAKNAGIRRARGEYVLASNIDILFSDELMRMFAERRLAPGRMYRIDRHDACADVPAGSIDEQLEYCRSNVIRVNKREGTFDVRADSFPEQPSSDITEAGSGLICDRGWFAVEGLPGPVWRWLGGDADLIVPNGPGNGRVLAIELEPGPGVAYGPLLLHVVDEFGEVLAEHRVSRRQVLKTAVPEVEGAAQRLRLHVPGGQIPVAQDPRALNAQVFRIFWSSPGEAMAAVRTGDWRSSVHDVIREAARHPWLQGLRPPGARLAAPPSDVVSEGSGIRLAGRWSDPETLNGVAARWAADGARIETGAAPAEKFLRLLVAPGLARAYAPCRIRILGGAEPVEAEIAGRKRVCVALQEGAREASLTLEIRGNVPARDARELLVLECAWAHDGESQKREGPAQKLLHTNACGDFTLLKREHWHELRGYPEFDAYSMHIDSVFCWAAHYAGFREEILGEPMRIYHIEHGSGSGWTPEGQDLLYKRITGKGIPWLEYPELVQWAQSMSRWGSPMIFNLSQWGLGEETLPETCIESPGAGTPERQCVAR